VRRRFTRSLLVLLAVVGLVAGCGDDDDDSTAAGDGTSTTSSTASGNTSSTIAPEDVRAPADEVAKGLDNIDGIAHAIADAVKDDDDSAATLIRRIEPIWQDIEGTIKANDEDAYLTFEDSFAALGLAVDDMDGGKAADAADDITAAVKAYLEAYPA
jgi:hypothetical protein